MGGSEYRRDSYGGGRDRDRDRDRERDRRDRDYDRHRDRRDRSPRRDSSRDRDRRDRDYDRDRRPRDRSRGRDDRRDRDRSPRDSKGKDCLPTSFSGREDRDGKKRVDDDDDAPKRDSRGKPKFAEDAVDDTFAPAAAPSQLTPKGVVSIAELLARLEKLQEKKDADRLREFAAKIDSLLLYDKDNRELQQLQQQASALISDLEPQIVSAASVPAEAPADAMLAAEVAAEAPQGKTLVEDSDEEWKRPPKRELGTVVSFNVRKGFGFLRPDDSSIAPAGQDIFVHKAAVQVEGVGHTILVEGQRVSFVLNDEGENGRKCALDVKDPDGNTISLVVDQSTLELRSHTETWRGLKDQQEDRWAGPEDLGELGQYFAIFDGHGGIFTSEYLARHMHKMIKTRKLSLTNFQMNEGSVRRLVSETFLQTDKELMKLPAYAKARDGSTALVALISGSETPVAGKPGNVRVYVANVGDSRAIMCRGGRGVRLSEDHKPNRGDEERRIKNAGGCVVNIGGISRVTTTAGAGHGVNLKEHQYLAVSRSFGDYELKAPHPLVTCSPEIKVFDITEEDSFIVMACDGIWDVLDDQAVCEIASQHFGRPQDAAASVVRTAYQKGSGDNLTATVIEFGWVTPEQVKSHMESYVEEQEKVQDEDLDMFGD